MDQFVSLLINNPNPMFRNNPWTTCSFLKKLNQFILVKHFIVFWNCQMDMNNKNIVSEKNSEINSVEYILYTKIDNVSFKANNYSYKLCWQGFVRISVHNSSLWYKWQVLPSDLQDAANTNIQVVTYFINIFNVFVSSRNNWISQS